MYVIVGVGLRSAEARACVRISTCHGPVHYCQMSVLCADIFFGAHLFEVVYVVVGVSVSCIPHAFIAGTAHCILVRLPELSAFIVFSLSLSLSD